MDEQKNIKSLTLEHDSDFDKKDDINWSGYPTDVNNDKKGKERQGKEEREERRTAKALVKGGSLGRSKYYQRKNGADSKNLC